MKIAIAGAGGIGSNVALNLVRSGVEQFSIIDFDRVEASNLNRQFYFADQIGMYKVEALVINLTRINPAVRITPLVERINAENVVPLFEDCRLVVEGFDQSQDKKMLLETLGPSKIVVSASGIAGSELAPVCSKRFGQGCIAGDFSTDCTQAPLYSHKVTTVANYMTEFILGVFNEYN
nr:sulfur carrier protein ThiS adenylyltransferase ThiF [uncultured Desulfobulbus sp.]